MIDSLPIPEPEVLVPEVLLPTEPPASPPAIEPFELPDLTNIIEAVAGEVVPPAVRETPAPPIELSVPSPPDPPAAAGLPAAISAPTDSSSPASPAPATDGPDAPAGPPTLSWAFTGDLGGFLAGPGGPRGSLLGGTDILRSLLGAPGASLWPVAGGPAYAASIAAAIEAADAPSGEPAVPPSADDPTPAPERPQAPLPAPGGAVAAPGGGTAAGSFFVTLLALFSVAGLSALALSRLAMAPASLRPQAFIALLERPG